MKEFIKNFIRKCLFIRKIYINLFNDIKYSKFEYNLTTFKNNRICSNDLNTIKYKENSNFYHSSIKCDGKGNLITFGENINADCNESLKINIIGNNNEIIIGDNIVLNGLSIFIRGNNNKIKICNACSITLTNFHFEQDNNSIYISKGNTMHGRDGKNISFVLDEGTNIFVEEDCMISNNVQLRTTDSHSVVDLKGNRINPAKDIKIGKHCWIGLDVLILKGVTIGDNNVIAARSVCTKSINDSNCIIAGYPAKLIKKDVNWDRKFL